MYQLLLNCLEAVAELWSSRQVASSLPLSIYRFWLHPQHGTDTTTTLSVCLEVTLTGRKAQREISHLITYHSFIFGWSFQSRQKSKEAPH